MIRTIALWMLAAILIGPAVAHAADITPPDQPADGPGGAKAVHASVKKSRFGDGGKQYWIYEPADPVPATAPVIVFLHGWSAMDPAIYGAWIDHLVKRGNIVIYPRYQAGLLTRPTEFTENAVWSIRDAFTRLTGEAGHVRPELDHVAAVGHSVGGVLAANVCALAVESKLPVMKAVMSVEPGITAQNAAQGAGITLADLRKMPAGTLLLAVAGDQDELVGNADALRIFRESVNVAAGNKNYVMFISDDHGTPPLKAGHLAPIAFDPAYKDSGDGEGGNGPIHPRLKQRAGGRNGGGGQLIGVDAMDYFGYWKLFDGLTDAAFYGKNREYALGNTPRQRFMGRWSDGTAVKELQVVEKP